MERFENLIEDYDLAQALDDLKSTIGIIDRVRAKNMILAASLTELGKGRLPTLTAGDGAYGYIPIDLNQFLDIMFRLKAILAEDPDYQHSEKPHRPCSFVEVGCGPGRNLHVLGATDCFTLEKISGFDIEPEFVEMGRRYFDLGEDIFVQDALTFDYGGYDIIYFYRPFHDDALQKKFERQVVKTAKSGAYILAQLDSAMDKSRSVVVKDSNLGIYKRL